MNFISEVIAHWDLAKIVGILQSTLTNVFSALAIIVFWFKIVMEFILKHQILDKTIVASMG